MAGYKHLLLLLLSVRAPRLPSSRPSLPKPACTLCGTHLSAAPLAAPRRSFPPLSAAPRRAAPPSAAPRPRPQRPASLRPSPHTCPHCLRAGPACPRRRRTGAERPQQQRGRGRGRARRPCLCVLRHCGRRRSVRLVYRPSLRAAAPALPRRRYPLSTFFDSRLQDEGWPRHDPAPPPPLPHHYHQHHHLDLHHRHHEPGSPLPLFWMQRKRRAESELTGDSSRTAPSPFLATSMGEQVGHR